MALNRTPPTAIPIHMAALISRKCRQKGKRRRLWWTTGATVWAAAGC
jgi:hypothetical protein